VGNQKNKGGIKKFLEFNENESTNLSEPRGHSKGSAKGKVYSHECYIKTEKSQINDLVLQLKLLEKQEQAKPKTSRRREIIKIRAEINKIETNKQTKKPYKESAN
jgi:hypothetical protein